MAKNQPFYQTMVSKAIPRKPTGFD